MTSADELLSRIQPHLRAAPPYVPVEPPDEVAKRLGMPAVRLAIRQAMRLLGSHFVLAETIEEAVERATPHEELRYSFDMLGEGARTAADAERYFQSYATAINTIGRSAGNHSLPDRPGISPRPMSWRGRSAGRRFSRIRRRLVRV